jgi:hypothetical protein
MFFSLLTIGSESYSVALSCGSRKERSYFKQEHEEIELYFMIVCVCVCVCVCARACVHPGNM